MTYRILVEESSAGSFQATALGLPEYRVVATTRKQALSKLRAALVERLSRAEIVELEIPEESSVREHSWKRFAGMFEDDPLFDEALEAIEEHRREVDADSHLV